MFHLLAFGDIKGKQIDKTEKKNDIIETDNKERANLFLTIKGCVHASVSESRHIMKKYHASFFLKKRGASFPLIN